MKYEKTITLTKETAAQINSLIEQEPENEDSCFGEDDCYTETATFDNGFFMDIDLCGVEYEEGGCNTPWSQAVLFAPDGGQVCFTEPGDDFFGEWALESDGDTYVVYVKEEAA